MGNGILTSWRRLVISGPKVLVLPVALLSWGHRAAAQGHGYRRRPRNSPAERRDRPAGPGPRRGTPGRRKCGRRRPRRHPDAAGEHCVGVSTLPCPRCCPPTSPSSSISFLRHAAAGTMTWSSTGPRDLERHLGPGAMESRDPGVSGGGPPPFTMTTPTLRETAPGQLTRIIASFEGTTLKVYTNGQRLYRCRAGYSRAGRCCGWCWAAGRGAGGLSGQAPGGGRGGVRLVRCNHGRSPGTCDGTADRITRDAEWHDHPVGLLPHRQRCPLAKCRGQLQPSSTGNPATASSCGAGRPGANRSPGCSSRPRVPPRSAGLPYQVRQGTRSTAHLPGRQPGPSSPRARSARRALTETYFPPTRSGPHTPIESLRISLTAESGPPRWNSRRRRRAIRPVSPPGWRSGSSRAHLDKLCRCDASRRGRLSPEWTRHSPRYQGPRLGSSARHLWPLRGHRASWRLARVSNRHRVLPGRCPHSAASWPKAPVRMAPVSAVPLLSRERCRDSGRVQPAHLQRRQVARHPDVFINDWCAVQPNSIYATSFAFPLLSLFDIYEAVPRFDDEGWWPDIINRIAPVNDQSSFRWQWFRNGSTIPSANFTDLADLGRDRQVACMTRGSGAQSTVMCWGHSGGVPGYTGGGQGQTLSVIVQTWTETHFLTFNNDIHIDPTCVGSECRALPGAWCRHAR